MTAAAELIEQFSRIFGDSGRIHVIRAPGRVNLIGEHTDYNDGFVFPMAIEPEVRIACRARDDGHVRLASTAFPGTDRRVLARSEDHTRRARLGQLHRVAWPPS